MMKSAWFAGVLATALLTGCKGDAAEKPRGVIDPSATAAEVLADLERRLMEEPSLKFGFEIKAEGAVDADLKGTFEASWPDVTIAAKGTFAGQPVELGLRADESSLTLDSKRTKKLDRPAELRDALMLGLTRMGLLHNLAVLTGGGPPDRADGGVRDWIESREIESREIESIEPAGKDAVTLGFTVRVAGQDSATAKLVVDRKTGHPRRREQTVRFPTGEMRVVETYRF